MSKSKIDNRKSNIFQPTNNAILKIMNLDLLIDSIRKNNDLSKIALASDISIDDLKSFMIESIRLNPPPPVKEPNLVEEISDTISEDEYDSDNEEDYYDRIIRKSPIEFSDEQIAFLELAVKERKNVLLAAAAGFGKSSIIETAITLFDHVLKPLSMQQIRKQYGGHCNIEEMMSAPTYGLCASTGRAASLIKGRTLHSYFGVGIGKGSVDDWIRRVSTARYLREIYINLRAVQVIIIDEVSMISNQFLDKISEYLQRIRRCDKPFGGVQMIFIGDFAQLGPVQGSFMFKSSEYKAANVQTHLLTKCFRQNDPTLLKILNEIRFGSCSDESFDILKSQTSIDEEYSQGLKPMRIVSTNSEVDAINEKELLDVCQKSKMTPVSFPIKYVGSDTKKAESYRKADAIPEDVKLVVGAQIVITHNISRQVVNGSQGVITQIRPNDVVVSLLGIGETTIGYFGYKDPEHNDIYTAKNLFQYLPLRLSYASTVHKVQGMGLRLIEIDFKKVFCSGQAYTALSRAHSLRGVIVKNLSKKAIICDPSVKQFLNVM